MADKRLASGNIASTSLTSVYAAPSNNNVRIYSMYLTNTTANNIDVDIYLNDGASRLVKSVTIPGGSGKGKPVYDVQGLKGGDTLSFQAGSTGSFNYFIFGREI